jgi:transposase-like protein
LFAVVVGRMRGMIIYTPELAANICEQLAAGRSLRAVCRDEGMPAPSTVLGWVEKHEDFREHYTRARQTGYALLAEEIIEISDEEVTTVRADKHPSVRAGQDGEIEVVFDSTAVARNRLRVDTRKWMLSKMLPKIYGDKQEVTHKVDEDTAAAILAARKRSGG